MNAFRELILGTAGHIDHGKTTLVHMLTGIGTDRLPEEIKRGISIDLGFADMELPGSRLALIDVPGHEKFIRNMLAGASGFDLAMLVVAADDSVMPQTREHLDILCLLGLAGGVIVVTKCDLVDSAWIDLVEDDIKSLVNGTFLQNAEIIRTSVVTGDGIAKLRGSLERLCKSAPKRFDAGPFRLSIDRSFTVAGHGTVVTGTVISGEVVVDDELEWLPTAEVVRVRGIERHGVRVERVGQGARAALNLAGLHHDRIRRGHELASIGYLSISKILSVVVKPTHGMLRPLQHRARYRCHLGTAEVGATLMQLETEVSGDAPILGQLFLSEPVACTHGQPFILRQESPQATIGGGIILQPVARRIRRREGEAIAALRQLTDPQPAARIASVLAFTGFSPWTQRTLARDSGVSEKDLPECLNELTNSGRLIELTAGNVGKHQVLTDTVLDLEARMLRTLERLHSANSRHSSIVRPKVAAAFPDLCDETVISAIIDRLKTRGQVVADSRTVALANHTPRLSRAERELKGKISDAFRLSGLTFLRPEDWKAIAGSRAAAIPDLIALLIEEERIVQIGPLLYLDCDVVTELRQRVRGHLHNGARMTMAELRDLLATTRKSAVPIGEYLDRIGLTFREGNVRRLGNDFIEPNEEGESIR